jgi:putative intracellular protease/amidase
MEAMNLDDVAGIIIPGGWNDEQRPELTELIQKLDMENKFVAAICAGPQYLARAGILKGKKYTTTMTEKVYKERGTYDPFPRDTYVEQNVVRDGNIITAVGAAFIDFAIEIADYMKLFDNAEERESFTKAYKQI